VEGYIGLGSNLGDRAAHLRGGLDGLAGGGIRVTAESSAWETEPVESPEPLAFLNLVVRVDTELGPMSVLERLHDIERRAGRIRSQRNAPRILDLDLLILDDLRCEGPDLVLPHPRMWERRFVLEPLAEIAPALREPRTGRTVADACRDLAGGPWVRKLGPLDRLGRSSGV
jgi:2-amino-4-hydroxy-6-hydroxymethyldihydropteridine diphosphokinase